MKKRTFLSIMLIAIISFAFASTPDFPDRVNDVKMEASITNADFNVDFNADFNVDFNAVTVKRNRETSFASISKEVIIYANLSTRAEIDWNTPNRNIGSLDNQTINITITKFTEMYELSDEISVSWNSKTQTYTLSDAQTIVMFGPNGCAGMACEYGCCSFTYGAGGHPQQIYFCCTCVQEQ
jgi:hypothetical protein